MLVKNQSTNGSDRHQMTPLQIKTLKLESVALDDARWAGMLPVAGNEPVHIAAGNAGAAKPLIIKRNVDHSKLQGGEAPGTNNTNE